MNPTSPASPPRHVSDDDVPVLEPALIRRIEQALARVGDFGEIGLVVVKGQVKFIRIMCSESLAERPGT